MVDGRTLYLGAGLGVTAWRLAVSALVISGRHPIAARAGLA
jgi:hypothetical protein